MSTPKPKKHSPVIAVLAGIVTITGIILIWRYLKGKNPPSDDGDSMADSIAAKPKQAPASSFPIKVGSKNDLVKQLQQALGISDDSIFGPKTLAALTAQTGKTSITSQAEFDKVITDLQKKPIVLAGKNRADSLTAQWKAGSSLQLMALQKVTVAQFVQDAARALHPTGKSVILAANVKLSRKDYVPQGASTSGFLVFDILNGALKGRYKVDPSKMTVA